MTHRLESLLAQSNLGLRAAADLASRQTARPGGPPAIPRPPEAPGLLPQDLLAAGVHEWFFDFMPADPAGSATPARPWYAPVALLTILAAGARPLATSRKFVWIGRACWPTLPLLYAALDAAAPADGGPVAAAERLRRCIFLDPHSSRERFWAIGEALRCSGVAAVVADGAGLDATASRRLQLAAERGGGAVAFLARPPWEAPEPSWAATRWRVRPCDSSAASPRWRIGLLRCRQRWRGGAAEEGGWVVEWEYEVFRGTGTCRVFSDVGRRAGSPPAAPGGSAWTVRTA